MRSKRISLNVNGDDYELAVDANKTLLDVLRDDLKLTGTKFGCGTGECGACTVLVDAKATLSCITLAVAVEGKKILTIEGMAKEGKLSPLQESFVKHHAFQCGYCTPGMVMSATALLNENPNPTEREIKEYLRGNICRCTGYVKIIEAVSAVTRRQ